MYWIAFLLLIPAWWGLAVLGLAFLGDATPDGRARVAHFFDRLEAIPSKAAGHATAEAS